MDDGEILDHMIYDGLQSPFDGRAMGSFGDSTAAKYNFTRAAQDAFAANGPPRHARDRSGRIRRRSGAGHGEDPQGRDRYFTR